MLQNISLRYDPVEDRLAMCLVVHRQGGEAQEHWLHLTRRVCTGWRQDLQAMVDLSAQVPAQMDGASKQAVSAAHHQAMVGQAAVRTDATPSPVEPAITPTLVTKVVCGRRRQDQRWMIRFERLNEPPLSLMLNSKTLHGLVDAVFRRVKVAGWALPPLPAESAPSSGNLPTSILH
ncbi:MAG: hypothetical protein IPP44_27800 [Ideonella sp.]|jgi:hypothetical protein|nr:hypothetical protein [Ideonella sp.]